MIISLLLTLTIAKTWTELNSEQIPEIMEWEDWKEMFEKTGGYQSQSEHDYRRSVYNKNVHLIRTHNAKNLGYRLGVNQFADLTKTEYARLYLTKFNTTRPRNEVYLPKAQADTVDWRDHNAVTPVKNQKQCGSCWAFSTTGSVEGAIAIKDGKLISLSEQQLVDCSTKEGDHGCGGGLMDYGFKYIMDNGGLDTESDYPYTAHDGHCNSAKAAKHAITITGYHDVPSDNAEQFASAVEKGPVSIAIEADQSAFQLYKSGVFSSKCGTKLDHGVLCVGYASDYWIVKNSWGPSWGENGYIRMSRTAGGTKGQCGMLMQPSYPVAGSVGPSPGPTPTPGPPGPSPGPPYEKPHPGCEAGEQAVQVQGVDGSFCTPGCRLLIKSCPPAPTGVTAEAQCALEDESTHSKSCALICDPSDDSACDPKAGMTCKGIQGTGICTYDDSELPPKFLTQLRL